MISRLEGMKVFITGITGQTGSYLAELLLADGCEVHGQVRRSSSFNRFRIEHLRSNPEIYGKKLFLHYSDLNDPTTMRRLLGRLQPDELYHLAGQSHVGLSFDIPESTCNEIAGATLSILEICRDLQKKPRIFHASSAEVFGDPLECPQNEESAFRPLSPYGCAKAFATNIAKVYRDAYGLFVCNGILYNHESPRRGENFVTKKIAVGAALHKLDSSECLELGNLSSERDWGYALEYAQAMIYCLRYHEPGDYVLASGSSTTVRDFACAAYAGLGTEINFEGSGLDEVGVEARSGRVLIKVNPLFYRPCEPLRLIGDASKAAALLQWRTNVSSFELAGLMAEAEYSIRLKSSTF